MQFQTNNCLYSQRCDSSKNGRIYNRLRMKRKFAYDIQTELQWMQLLQFLFILATNSTIICGVYIHNIIRRNRIVFETKSCIEYTYPPSLLSLSISLFHPISRHCTFLGWQERGEDINESDAMCIKLVDFQCSMTYAIQLAYVCMSALARICIFSAFLVFLPFPLRSSSFASFLRGVIKLQHFISLFNIVIWKNEAIDDGVI